MINFLYPYFLCVLDCLVLYIGFYVCFKKERKDNLLLIVTSTFLFAYFDYLITDVWVMNEWVSGEIVKVVLFIFLSLNYSGSIMKKIVYFLIIECIQLICIMFIGVSLELMGQEFVSNGLALSLIFHSVCLILSIIVGIILNKTFHSLDEKSIEEIFKSLFIPCIIMTMLFELYFVIENQMWFNIILVLFIIAFIAMIRTLIRIVTLTQRETKNAFIEKIAEQTHEQMERIDEYNKEIRGIKHDFKNHLIIIEKMAKDGKIEELIKYLHEFNATLNNKETPVISGNIYLDAILNYKKEENENIVFDYSMNCSNQMFIDEVDLCSLVFNLLDNAIYELNNHSELDRKITFSMKQVNNELFIKVRNPLSVKKDLASEKKDKVNHGLGLEIVRKIVDKYDGEIEVTQNDEFIVEIMLVQKHTT